MAWLSTFLLGRPGFEETFDVGPAKMEVAFERTSADQRNLVGDLKERILRVNTPTAVLSSDWFPKAQLDKFVSLLGITDTFLSFITRTGDLWNITKEPNLALTTSTVLLQNTSFSKLSAAYVAAGLTSQITIAKVAAVADGSGTDYFAGGSYNDTTRTLTLGTPLPQVQQVYISYACTGWLCRLKSLRAPIEGGRVDLFKYEFKLDGV